jgi:cell division protein ZapA (FtsZ GTPase activity inhibitor)
MDDKLSIRVNIADRYYPLKIERKEEEKIRKAAKLINDSINQYKNKYGDKDLQDLLSMVALQYVTKAVDNEFLTNDSEFIEEVKELSKQIGEYLNNK